MAKQSAMRVPRCFSGRILDALRRVPFYRSFRSHREQGVPRFARQGGAIPIEREVIARSLDCRFTLRAPDQSVFDAIRYLDCTPEVTGPPPREVTIVIEPTPTHYRIVEDGILLQEVRGARAVIHCLHAHLFRRSLADRPGAALLHAACLRRNGRRLLLAGTKSAGKTTFAVALTRAGYEIEGDEHVFINGDGVVARPRGCRVKEPALAVLAEIAGDLAAAIAASPSYTDEIYGTIFNVDPRALGSTWRIETGQVDLVIVLQPNHGGCSSIRPLPPTALVRSLIPEIGLRETGHGASIAAVAALAGRAKAFGLSLGDHASATRCVELALEAAV